MNFCSIPAMRVYSGMTTGQVIVVSLHWIGSAFCGTCLHRQLGSMVLVHLVFIWKSSHSEAFFFFPPKPRSLNFYSSAQYFLFILWIKQLFLNSLLPSHELGVEVENNCSILTYDFTQYSHALPVQSLRHLGGWVGPWGGATVLQGTHSFLHVSSMVTGHLLYVFRPHSAYLDVFKSYTLQRWGPKGQSDNSVGRLHLPSSSNNP